MNQPCIQSYFGENVTDTVQLFKPSTEKDMMHYVGHLVGWDMDHYQESLRNGLLIIWV